MSKFNNQNLNTYPGQTLSPCKGCGDRVLGCHSSCGKYKDWVQDEKQKYEEHRKKKALDREIDEYVVNHYMAVQKEKDRKGRIARGGVR